MRSTKQYTNQTFTKRVDHEGGSHRESAGLPEPTVCMECGAVYVNRRWSLNGPAIDVPKKGHWHPAKEVTCPACFQVKNGIPGGYLTIGGDFLSKHRDEIDRLLINEAQKAREDNPLSRIMSHVDIGSRILLETTTEHLAQRLGRALEKAYDGEVSYEFSHENKVARVTWRREE